MKLSLDELKMIEECISFYLVRFADEYDVDLIYDLKKKVVDKISLKEGGILE